MRKGILHQITGAIVTRGHAAAALDGAKARFYAHLKADRWPFVGVACLTLPLRDGTHYRPHFVTAVEGAVTVWEVANRNCESRLARLRRVLPPQSADAPTVYYCVAYRSGEGFATQDIVPMSDFVEFDAARTAIERTHGGAMTDWEFRDWCESIERDMSRRCAPSKKAHLSASRTPTRARKSRRLNEGA